MPDASTLQHLIDRAAIRDVMVRYARGLDRRDFDLVRTCFTADATADYGAGAQEALGIDRIIATVQAVERFQFTMHFMGDQTIDLHDDHADVETYAKDHLRYTVDGHDYDMTGGLRYVDRFVRQNGEWRIAARVMHTDWRRLDPVVESPGPVLGP